MRKKPVQRIEQQPGPDLDGRIDYLNAKLQDIKEPLVKRYVLSEIGVLFGLSQQFDQQANYFDKALNTHAPDSKDFFDFCYMQAHTKTLTEVNNGTKEKDKIK